MNSTGSDRENQPPGQGAAADRFDAFLSYARVDGDFAIERLRPALEGRGQRLWVDVDDIPGGTKWRQRIRRGIETCKAVLFVISPASILSEHCTQELEEAVALNKLIVPVLHRDVHGGSVPDAVAEAEWIFLRDSDDFTAGMDKLVEALETDIEWRDEHTRLAGRTREWLDSDRHSSYLLRGADLRRAESWLIQQEGHREAPTAEQAEYITRSRQSTSRRQRSLVAMLLVGFVVALGLTVVALAERHSAVDAAHRAQSQLVASAANNTPDPELKSVLGLEAYRLSPTVDARSAILTAAASHEIGAPLTGHTSQVNTVAYSPDGKFLVSGSSDNTVRLWDVATHRQRGAPLVGHARQIQTVAVSSDGTTVASAGDDATIRLWDVVSHRQLAKLVPADDPYSIPYSVAFGPSGKLLAAAMVDDTIRLWDLATRREVGHPLALDGNSAAQQVAFSPDGKTLAGLGPLGVQFWNVATRHKLGHRIGTLLINSIAFSPDGRTLAAASDGGLLLFDVASHRARTTAIDPRASMHVVAFSPDGKIIATDNPADNGVSLWDVATHKQVSDDLVGDTSAVSSVVFSPDSKTLATGSNDRTVRVWDTNLQSYRQVGDALIGHTARVNTVAVSPNGNVLASGAADNTVRLWTVLGHHQLGAPIAVHSDGTVDGVNSVAFSPDGRTLASADPDGVVMQWDVASHHPRGSGMVAGTVGVYAVAFSPDGKTLAAGTGGDSGSVGTGSGDNAVELWNVRTQAQLGTDLTGHTGSVNAVAFSPDGRIIASGSDDHTIRLWEVRHHRQLGAPLIGHTDTVNSVAFSRDGKVLASGSNDGTIRLWDVLRHRQLGPPIIGDGADSVALSPDGATLASSSYNGTIHFWDVASRRQLGAPLAAHAVSVAFGAKGKTLVSGDSDHTIRVWSLYPVSQYIPRACTHIDPRTAAQLWEQFEPSLPYQRPC